MWQCPTCKSADHLEVVVEAWARLVQPTDEPEAWETMLNGAHDCSLEWTENSIMICTNLECADAYEPRLAEEFEIKIKGDRVM
jgi:hypothetical protein